MNLKLLLALVPGLLLSLPAHAQLSVQESTLRVHVTGLVKRPGVYTLPPGARGVDAIQAAGGLAPGASVSQLNLAARLEDGQQLEVPKRGALGPTSRPTARSARPARPSRAKASGMPGSGRLSLNHASVEQLDGLPGIGKTLAAEIVRYRQQKGRFQSLEELKEVPGIGGRRFERLAPLLTL